MTYKHFQNTYSSWSHLGDNAAKYDVIDTVVNNKPIA